MAVTLKDVARHANVPVQAVSNVVNGKSEHAGANTRLQVLKAVAELNYRPNIAARHLRNAPVGVLAIALPDLSNPYFSDIATAVIRAAAVHDCAVLIDQTFADRAEEARVANGLRPHLIDGAILDPQPLQVEDLMALDAMHAIQKYGLRVPHDISVARIEYVEDGRYARPPLTTITPDKEEVARLAVNLLLARIDGARPGPPELFTPSFRLIVRGSTVGQ